MSLHFIRHGESRSNEQNRFAGRFDSPLTELGRRQAEMAAREITRAGLHFDEVHATPLIRAKETAEILLRTAGFAGLPVIETEALIERDFGALSEQNKSLIKKAYGHHHYETMFHRAVGAPPRGETFEAMYERTLAYYFEVLKPASDSGRRILVVAHKYIVEMFALIAADMKPAEYFDFKIPNSKASSFEDLGRRARTASPAAQASAEFLEIHLLKFIFLAAILGAVVKQAIDLPVREGGPAFTVLIGGLLAVNSFMAVLRLEKAVIFSSFDALRTSGIGLLLKAVAGFALLFGVRAKAGLAAGLFFLLPPAMTAPTLSLLWGGDYFLSARLTGAASILSPILLILAAKLLPYAGIPVALNLGGYFVLFGLSVIVPAVLAQAMRRRDPIEAGALSTNYGWVGGAVLIPLAFVSLFLFTPKGVIDLVGQAVANGLLLRDLAFVGGLFAAVRLIGKLSARMGNLDEGARFDAYLVQAFPNLFLWMALLPAGSDTDLLLPLMNLAFFASMGLEEFRAVRGFARKMRGLPAPTKGTFAIEGAGRRFRD